MKLNRLLTVAFCFAAALACPSGEARAANDVRGSDLEQRIGRVMAVKDGTVASLKVTLHTKADPEGKDPLEMWRAEEKEKVELKDAFVRVDFSLSPEEGSDIKCRAELPLPEKWDGRLWGQGNSGRAGSIRALEGYLAAGTAAPGGYGNLVVVRDLKDLGNLLCVLGGYDYVCLGHTESAVCPHTGQPEVVNAVGQLVYLAGRAVLSAYRILKLGKNLCKKEVCHSLYLLIYCPWDRF